MNHEQKKSRAPKEDQKAGKDLPARAFLNRNKCLKFYIKLICQPSPMLPAHPFYQDKVLAL